MRSILKHTALAVSVMLLASSCIMNFSGFKFGKSSKGIEGNGDIVTEIRALDDFETISLANRLDIEYIDGSDSCSVILTASSNLLPYIHTDVEGNALNISLRDDTTYYYLINDEDVRLTVYGKQINGVAIAGSAEFKAKSLKTSDKFSCAIAGSGDVDIKTMTCSDFECAVAGSGDVDIEKLSAKNVKAAIAGSGEISLGGLNSKNVEMGITGSGDVTLKGKSEKASFEIHGSGDIDAKEFKAQSLSSSVSGSGKIIQ